MTDGCVASILSNCFELLNFLKIKNNCNILNTVSRRPAVCADDETKVKTRWVFVEGTTCVDKIAEVTDFYNKVYLLECQWWQDLAKPPHSVAKSFVTECFDLSNGTTKYRANICCPGEHAGSRTPEEGLCGTCAYHSFC